MHVYNGTLRREYRECDEWRDRTLKRIVQEENPSLIVTSSLPAYKPIEDGKHLHGEARKQALVQGYVSTLKKLEVLDPTSKNAVVGMPRTMLEGTQEDTDGVLSNRRIASSLHLAEATIKRHLANVYEKMGVVSRGEAAREALLREWITIEEITAEDKG